MRCVMSVSSSMDDVGSYLPTSIRAGEPKRQRKPSGSFGPAVPLGRHGNLDRDRAASDFDSLKHERHLDMMVSRRQGKSIGLGQTQ